MRYSGLAFLLAASLETAGAQTFDPKLPSPVPEVTSKVTEQATLRYIDIHVGSGVAAKPGQQYTVHYTGWLRDGTQFDSSAGREPLQFVQGRREVIAGFDVGFESMQVGGKRRLFIPYQLAYGDQARGKIPPKSELIFDIELVGAKDAPPSTAAAELQLPFGAMEKQVISLAKAVPEEKYSWRPGPGVRSFQEVFLHIAFGNQLLLKVADSALNPEALKKQIEENAQAESQVISKEKVLEILAESFTAVRNTLDAARPNNLSRNADFFGTPTTRRGVLTALDTHIAEHLGQAIAYARMNGIVPPWSK
jgi:uncharacterized damage-inducible protein DinB